ncbi:bifunctional metallophosphatase/5'-nucleotidase [Methyloferula stellata]|uniref:bifunctional metallophosphatase/5'-nucleotidase n=1 Tax=Methyloferula stellata TaxID=876270 RepID=UPI00036F20E4|nr:bifunctional UDP-sugar hydrolase/5'-nucleotidase [Methyloferula stellata]
MPYLTRRATLASLAAGTSLIPLRAVAEPVAHLTFVLVNDVYEMDENAQKRGGLARLATVVKTERARALREGRTLNFVHAGDTLSPSLMSSFDQGRHMIALFNDLGLDIFVPGNHEFDFGPEVYSQRIDEAHFAILAANLRDASGQALPHHQDMLSRDVSGVKLAFIGAAYDATPMASRSGDLSFASTLATIKDKAKAARANGADFVVAIVHADKATGSALMAAHQVDLILSGHNHDLHLDFDGRTALAESHQDANYVVVIDIDLAKSKTEPSGLVWWPDFKVVDTASVAPDEEILDKTRAYQGALSKELDMEVATLAAPLDSHTELVRTQECAIGNLVADALRASVGADIAITNGGGIRGNRIYETGSDWTRRNVLVELPFGNKVVSANMSGQAILTALENGFSRLPQASGRFPQISGLKVTIAPAAAPGSRVQSALVNGEALDPARTYKLASNDFMARGGDGYTMFAGDGITVDTGDILLARAVMDYAQKLQTIDAKVEGRIVEV